MLRLDPVNPNSHLIHSLYWFMEGRFERAAELGAVFFKMAPEASMFVFWYALILAYAGRDQESQDVLAALPGEPADDGLAHLGLMLKCTLSEGHDGFRRLMTPRFEAFARRDLQWSWHVAAFCARLGEKELALNWLTNAVDRGFAAAQFIETTDPFLQSIRGNQRFHGLVERARQIQESIEA
jgi:lipoprotein NlpI